MNTLIKAIEKESYSDRYPDETPYAKIHESANPENIERLRQLIPSITDPGEKADAYGALGFTGRICKIDQSNYILDELLKEKNAELIEKTLLSLCGSQVPIVDRLETLKTWLHSKKTDLRHAAIAAMKLCGPDWPEAEQLLIRYYSETKQKYDLVWIAIVLSEHGSRASLPTLVDALESKKVTDGDGVCYILRGLTRLAAPELTALFLKVMTENRDTFLKKEAINGLIAGKDPAALDGVLERTKTILKKKHPGYFVDYVDGYSELQATMMYLKLFEKEDSRVPELLKWIKAERMHYMDEPTRKWAEQNL